MLLCFVLNNGNTTQISVLLYFLIHTNSTNNLYLHLSTRGNPCGSASKESACNAGDLGSIPGSGRSPEEGKGYALQYAGLENSVTVYPQSNKNSDTTERLSLTFILLMSNKD